MKASQFTYFKRGLLSESESTRKAYQSMGYAFFDLTEKQASRLAKALRDSGLYKYTDDKVILDVGIEIYF